LGHISNIVAEKVSEKISKSLSQSPSIDQTQNAFNSIDELAGKMAEPSDVPTGMDGGKKRKSRKSRKLIKKKTIKRQ
jgi:hypothetical protein